MEWYWSANIYNLNTFKINFSSVMYDDDIETSDIQSTGIMLNVDNKWFMSKWKWRIDAMD